MTFRDLIGRRATARVLRIRGLIVAVVLAVLGALLYQTAQGTFDDTFKLTVVANTIGEGLAPGAEVKFHGLAIGSVKDLEALLQAVTEAQRKRAQGEKVRLRALTMLDHILSLIHREQPDFSPLGEVQAVAKALRETLRASEDAEVHPDAIALAQGRHPLAEFLTLVEGYNHLDDDLWLLLQHAVAEHFGKPLAMSAARGRLCQSPARLIPDRSNSKSC